MRFDRPEIGHVHHEELVRDSKLAPHFLATLRWRRRREEIRNDLDLFAQLKGLLRLLPQTFRNRRDRIGMEQRVFDRGAVLGIWTEQSRVGSVQRRHDLRRGIADHFRGQEGRGRVRHGVVHVENIELILPADLGHFDGERQGVIGTREQTALTDRDLVEVNSRRRKVEPDRFGVAEEMNRVAAGREFGAERGRENSAAPDQRKTGDPDLERSRFHQDPIYAWFESEMSSRCTKVTPGASASLRYWRSPAPAT